jgi:hypothetical protein
MQSAPSSEGDAVSARSGPGREQAKGPGPLDGLGSPVRSELGVEMAHVGSDCVPRDEQLICDLRHGQVRREVAQDPDLAFAERIKWRMQSGGRMPSAGDPIENLGAPSWPAPPSAG